MKKLIDYIDSSESHDWAKYQETREALDEATKILINAEGSDEDRRKLLEAMMSHQWRAGGNAQHEGI